MTTVSRRRFLQVVGALGATGLFSASVADAQVTPELPLAPTYPVPTLPNPPAQPEGAAYLFFTPPEVAFVESAVSRLVPATMSGPGAAEAGVPRVIDRQLEGAFGLAAKWYTQGPWGEGAPEQGYQLPLNPQALYRVGVAALDLHCEETYGAVFASLRSAQQDAVLQGLEGGDLSVAGVPPGILSAFFELLLQNTQEGFFADPAYGGNRDKAGWRLVGHPGVSSNYADAIETFYNRPYRVEPVSIADVQTGRAQLDYNGYALHPGKPVRRKVSS